MTDNRPLMFILLLHILWLFFHTALSDFDAQGWLNSVTVHLKRMKEFTLRNRRPNFTVAVWCLFGYTVMQLYHSVGSFPPTRFLVFFHFHLCLLAILLCNYPVHSKVAVQNQINHSGANEVTVKLVQNLSSCESCCCSCFTFSGHHTGTLTFILWSGTDFIYPPTQSFSWGRWRDAYFKHSPVTLFRFICCKFMVFYLYFI